VTFELVGGSMVRASVRLDIGLPLGGNPCGGMECPVERIAIRVMAKSDICLPFMVKLRVDSIAV